MLPSGAHRTTKSLLERLASDCQAPPPTPVVGNVVVRHGMMSMETFYDKLSATHPHRRAVTVEITVPRHLLKCPPGPPTYSERTPPK